MYNSGQDCLCAERFYIHSTIYSAFLRLLKERIANIRHGPFGQKRALVCPCIDPIVQNLATAIRTYPEECSGVELPNATGLVKSQILELPINHPLMFFEKFCPLFTVAEYDNNSILELALESDFLFGATVCGDFESPNLSKYPHVSYAKSVIAAESEDAHVPFGGRRRSGFVAEMGVRIRDGPILYSVETTRSLEEPNQE